MLNSKTVFILGAGASSEVDFPLGSELKKIIVSKLDLEADYNGNVTRGEKKIFRHLNSKYPRRINEFYAFCRQISKGIVLSDSIDDFIDDHKHDERVAICGKLAIAYSILEAENCSKLSFNSIDNSINFLFVEDTWYAKFYSLLKKNITKDNIDNIFNNVTVINFNYDRSLEHYLINAISQNYLIEKVQAQNIVSKLICYHPYGSIDHSVEFGSDKSLDFDNIMSNLKTYTQQVEDVEGLTKVKQAIQDSEVIIFLGMAYHKNNMDLLQCECNITKKKIYATRGGIEDNELRLLKRMILNLDCSDIQDNIKYRFETSDTISFAKECRNLFDNYRLSLLEL